MLLRVLLLTVLGCLCPALASAAEPPAFVTSEKASVLVCGGSMMNGNHFADSVLETMRSHYRGVRKVALVLHADHPDDRARMETRLREAFEHLGGIEAESLHRHDRAGQTRLLETADGIFVGGGQTFVLLAELHRTGQLELIRRRVLAGVPYGGSSAGANVAGIVIGTTNDFPVAEIPTRGALAIFPAVINPHHPAPEETAEHDGRAWKIRTYLRFNPNETVMGLGNASIARLHRGKVVLETGRGWIYRHDGVRVLEIGEAVEMKP